MKTATGSRARAIALLAYVTLAWGLAWPVTKVAVEQVPIWHLRAGTIAIGGLLMLAIARALGHRIAVPRRELLWLALLGQFNVTAWCLLSAYGVSLMAAGRASIIGFTMPLWAAVIAAVTGRERMTGMKLLALALGLAGLLVLLLPDWPSVIAAPYGVLAMLGAAVSWAIGTLGVKEFRWSSATSVQTGWQLVFGALTVSIGLPIVGEEFDITSIGPTGWAAVFYLIVLSLLFASWAWFGAVHALSATLAGIGSLLVPVVGVIGSAIWLHEEIGIAEISALVLIGISVLLAMRPSEQAVAAPPPAPAGLRFGARKLR
jgi:drug/metabolite transporter (DMT)-like permease